MPRISSFYGIIIWMYFDDHNPPHFHATYGEFEILININDFSVYAGNFPGRAFGLLMEWASLHQQELLANWALMKAAEPMKAIEPLR